MLLRAYTTSMAVTVFPVCVGVGDGVPDDILNEDVEKTTSRHVNEARWLLKSTPPHQTTDCRLRDAMDVFPQHLAMAPWRQYEGFDYHKQNPVVIQHPYLLIRSSQIFIRVYFICCFLYSISIFLLYLISYISHLTFHKENVFNTKNI